MFSDYYKVPFDLVTPAILYKYILYTGCKLSTKHIFKILTIKVRKYWDAPFIFAKRFDFLK